MILPYSLHRQTVEEYFAVIGNIHKKMLRISNEQFNIRQLYASFAHRHLRRRKMGVIDVVEYEIDEPYMESLAQKEGGVDPEPKGLYRGL